MKKRGRSNPKKVQIKKIQAPVLEPAKTKFGIKNIVQIVVGATLLAIPVGLTEEVWRLGESLPVSNIIILLALSVFFVTIFAYRNFKKNRPDFDWLDVTKRVISTYIISFIVVSIILLIIQKAPWQTDWLLAFKRTIIVAFPSSMSGTLAGNLT